MKLDRNENLNGKGKYALVRLRNIHEGDEAFELLQRLHALGHLDWGYRGAEDEFFVIKLRDKYAPKALNAYGKAAFEDDQEWGSQVMAMASRAEQSPFKKSPD